MILVIAFAWFLLSAGIFLSLIAAAYYVHVREGLTMKLVAKSIASIAIHTVIVIPGGVMAGMYMFAQAHSSSPLAIDTKEVVVACLFLGFEAIVGWLLFSAIVGRLIGTRESID
jgi:hypothetical protein